MTDTEAPVLLQSALEQLRLEGAIFFRSELTEGFAFESTPQPLADALHPGASELILFHIVARGSCWVAGDDGVRHWAEQGDVIVLPYGDHHIIGGESPAELRLDHRRCSTRCRGTQLPTIRHGGGGARVDLVCGYLHSEDPLFDPALRVFPPAFVVRLPDGAAARWVQASIAYSMEEHAPPTNLSGSAHRDPPARAGAHRGAAGAPRRRRRRPTTAGSPRCAIRCWPRRCRCSTARPNGGGRSPSSPPGAAVSRSLLDERFRQVLGRSPIRYLTEWRMHLAEDLLATTDIGVAAVARRVGYDSEEAFSRAFKRAHGAVAQPLARRPSLHRDPVNREIVVARLRAAGCVAADEEAACMLATTRDADTLEAWLRRRADGVPLAWITGWTTFCGARLHVAPGVYVPRQQTEELARRAAARAPAVRVRPRPVHRYGRGRRAPAPGRARRTGDRHRPGSPRRRCARQRRHCGDGVGGRGSRRLRSAAADGGAGAPGCGGVAVRVRADLCTGTGVVAAYLRRAVPDARVIGIDRDLRAARCAANNGVTGR